MEPRSAPPVVTSAEEEEEKEKERRGQSVTFFLFNVTYVVSILLEIIPVAASKSGPIRRGGVRLSDSAVGSVSNVKLQSSQTEASSRVVRCSVELADIDVTRPIEKSDYLRRRYVKTSGEVRTRRLRDPPCVTMIKLDGDLNGK